MTVENRINSQKDLIDTVTFLSKEEFNPAILSKDEQNMVIEYLRYERNFTIVKIAQTLDLHKDTVRHRLDKIDETYRASLIARGFDPWTVLADLQRKKEIVQTKAAQKNNWGLFWRTEMDFIDKLTELGFLKHYNPDIDLPPDEDVKGLDTKTLREMIKQARESEKKNS